MSGTQDCFLVDPEMGMDTTVRSFVFVGEKPKRTAKVIEQVSICQ